MLAGMQKANLITSRPGLVTMSELSNREQAAAPTGAALANSDSRVLASHEHGVSRQLRLERNGHEGAVVWLTGLSGAGKTTLAMALERSLFDQGCEVYVLDGDNLRHGLNRDLGFKPEDRSENIRRVGEVAALFADAGVICIVALISPYRADRERARAAARPGSFFEVHVAASVEVCESRDPRGLYKMARSGVIKNFTGIDAPYEEPLKPEVVVNTGQAGPDACVRRIEGRVLGMIRRASERVE